LKCFPGDRIASGREFNFWQHFH